MKDVANAMKKFNPIWNWLFLIGGLLALYDGNNLRGVAYLGIAYCGALRDRIEALEKRNPPTESTKVKGP